MVELRARVCLTVRDDEPFRYGKRGGHGGGSCMGLRKHLDLGTGGYIGSWCITFLRLRKARDRAGCGWLLATLLWGKLVDLRVFERALLGGIAASRPGQAWCVLDICNGSE
jgi:hypothetical protein